MAALGEGLAAVEGAAGEAEPAAARPDADPASAARASASCSASSAEHADIWNGFGPVEKFARKNRVLDELVRDGRAVIRPSIERSVTVARAGTTWTASRGSSPPVRST